MAKHRISKTTPHDSRGTLVLRHKRRLRNSDEISPNGGAKCEWVGKICVFGRLRSLRLRRLTAVYLCPVHLPRWSASTTVRWWRNEYAGLSTSLVVVELEYHSYGPVDINKVSCMKVCWWHPQLLVEIHISGIKRGICLKCSPGWHGRSVCVIRTTVRHFNWYRASRWSLGDSWGSCYREYSTDRRMSIAL